jgi:ribonuclease R
MKLIAEIVAEGRAARALGPDRALVELAAGEPSLAAGTIVGVELAGGGARLVGAPLAEAGTARAALWREAADAGLDPFFPEDVEREVAALERDPGLDDPRLDDLSALPFVTIDGPSSRDLDQALALERGEAGGFVVHYALADAAHFVQRDSALFAEALKRGASFYLPGFAIPMLPRALSEGLCSLNPDVPRRALVFTVALDARGDVLSTRVRRARIRSRRKLAWGDVQGYYDAPTSSPLRGEPFAETLDLLRAVGEVRIQHAIERGLVRHRREEVDLGLGEGGVSITVTSAMRDAVELYNEQISLLVNAEGARLLKEHPSPTLEPIYRVHPAPDADHLAALRATIGALCAAHGLPDVPFRWREEQPLAEYLRALPEGGEHGRVARAIERQALLVNLRSTYATEPGPHHGVGVEPYGRFTAPMREIVGIFLHHETLDAFFPGPDHEPTIDPDLRAAVVAAGNAAKDVQRKVSDAGSRLAIDRLFGADLARPLPERPARTGTVMGLTRSKVHVTLDDPPLDLKIYLRELGKALGGAWLEVDPDGVTLRVPKTGQVVLRVGDAVRLVTVALDRASDRWILRPVR